MPSNLHQSQLVSTLLKQQNKKLTDAEGLHAYYNPRAAPLQIVFPLSVSSKRSAGGDILVILMEFPRRKSWKSSII